MKTFTHLSAANMSRRRFVLGLAAGGTLAGLSRFASAQKLISTAPITAGNEFSLFIDEIPVNYTGSMRTAFTVNGGLPGPVMRWREGSTVALRVTNRLSEPTSIHWHGIRLPFQMDGVPGISFKGIAPGETFVYRFPVTQSGTYWYHGHSSFQELRGLYGGIIIDSPHPNRFHADRDYVVMLNDWSDDDPAHIFSLLKKRSDYYNVAMPTVQNLLRDIHSQGLREALSERRMWNRMRMERTDVGDVSSRTFTYLMNGCTPAMNWTGLFCRGERIRLRFINSSTMTIFDVRIPGRKMTVISSDGQDIEPVSVDELRMSVAETYDVIVEPKDNQAYTVFAQSIDRSGYVRGTLAPKAHMEATIPELDPHPILSTSDMMGAMSMDRPISNMHSVQSAQAMQDMPGMSMLGNTTPQNRIATGPGVDMVVATPRTNLDDPGVGLRENGRRVLTYSDLHTIGGSLDTREPQRVIELHLTGNMQRYMWSFDGVPFADASPIAWKGGERVRIALVNDTMMNHPIHLHGMWSELETQDGNFQVRKHTVDVQPGQRLAYGVTADALGRWAYHCHLMYHMHAGMFREVVVS